MSDRKLAFVYAPEVEDFPYPADCPFKTSRTGLTRQRLRSLGLLGSPDAAEIRARPATRAELERFHTADYLDEMQRAAGGDLTVAGFHMGFGGPETPVFPHMYHFGAWACGAALTAADVLLDGRADIAFSLLGGFHHAWPARAGGFCYLNDVVLACQQFAAAGKRVLYLDVDAHHGDGVQAAFYTRPDILTLSLHESGTTLFPWGGFEHEIGEGPGLGYNVNVSLPAGTYDDAFLLAFDQAAAPLIHAFAPDAIVLELGLDGLAGDPLTHLTLTNNAFVAVLQRLLPLHVPLLVAGGGGYHVENTVRGWALAWNTCGDDGAADDYSVGMGGVMLGSSEWAGGLRDRQLAVPPEQRRQVEPAIQASLAAIRQTVFPRHKLAPP